MANSGRGDALAEAFAHAMRDAFLSWWRENARGEERQLAWAQHVKRIEINAQYAPGGRGVCVVQVIDRRPGRSNLEHYVIETKAGQPRIAS